MKGDFGYSGGSGASSTKYTPPKVNRSATPMTDKSQPAAKKDAGVKAGGGDSGGTAGRSGGAS